MIKAITANFFGLVHQLKDFVLRRSDPVLSLFLLLITNYRFSFKIIALVAIYAYRPNFRFQRNGVFWFYTGIIVLSVLNTFFFSSDLSAGHLAVVSAACAIWLACLLTFHQLNLFVANNPMSKLVNSLKTLVVINLLFSIFDLFNVMLKTRTVNPYTQMAPPPYGISSGDLIGGVFGEMHLVNMSISAFLLLFFLYRKNLVFVFFTIVPTLLTGSNLGTLILVGLLLCAALTQRSLLLKHQVIFVLAIVIVFYVKITPDNLAYFQKTFSKLTGKTETLADTLPANDSAEATPTEEEIKRKKIEQYLAYVHKQEPVEKEDTVYYLKMAQEKARQVLKQKQEDYRHFVQDSLQKAKNRDRRFRYGKLRKFDFNTRSGKMISFAQLYNYLKGDPKHLLFGSGPGGFSSRLAFITSGIIGDSRILMALPYYENQAFTDNHLAIFHYLQYLDDQYHSVTNLPFSWYNELFGEYGLLGALLFFTCYMGFFARHFKLYSVGRLLLPMILAFFLFDYWFQRLSVMVLFEFIMLLDVKTRVEKEANDAAE